MRVAVQFGERVRQLRKRAGLTQDELARKSPGRMDMQSISAIELGDRNCTLETIAALAEGLACDPIELFVFDPKAVGERLSQLDARLLDFWNGADEQTKAKAIRILSELS